MSYSLDLRRKIVAAYEAGKGTQQAIADWFGVCRKTVNRYCQRAQQTGDVQSRSSPGRPPRLDKAGLTQVEALVAQEQDATLAELCTQYQALKGQRVSVTTMHRACEKLRLRPKKKQLYARERETAAVKKNARNSSKRC